MLRNTCLYITLLALPALAGAEYHLEILDSDRVSRDGDVVVFEEPADNVSVLRDGPLMLHREAVGKSDKFQVLRFSSEATAASAWEAVGFYDGGKPFSMPRRHGNDTMHLLVPRSDSMTSMTLTLRNGEENATARVSDLEFVDFNTLSLKDALHSWTDTPLHPIFLRPNPEEDVFAALRFAFPGALRSRLARADLQLDEPFNKSITIGLNSDDVLTEEELVIEVPAIGDVAQDSAIINLSARIDGKRQVIASTTMPIKNIPWPRFEVPASSINEFWATERNGELVIYTAATSFGFFPDNSGLHVPAETIWVAAGDGIRWPLFEPALRTRRDDAEFAGGPLSIGGVSQLNNMHVYYTLGRMDGTETVNYANSTNSLRLTPVVVNPLRDPKKVQDDTKYLRGNAVFAINQSRVLYTLEGLENQDPKLRLFVTKMKTRWNDLGIYPELELAKGTMWLNGSQDEDQYYMITGPEVHLYVSSHPLFGWEERTLKDAPNWDDLQVVSWLDQLWLMGLQRVADRNVVVWCPLEELEDGSFHAQKDFDFDPPTLYENINLPEPTPPPLRKQNVQ